MRLVAPAHLLQEDREVLLRVQAFDRGVLFKYVYGLYIYIYIYIYIYREREIICLLCCLLFVVLIVCIGLLVLSRPSIMV